MLYLHPNTLTAINFDQVPVDNFKAENPDGLYVTAEWLEAMIDRGFDLAHLAKFSLRPDALRHFESLVDVAWDCQQLAKGFIDALQESDHPFWIGQLVHFEYANAPIEPDKQYPIGKVATISTGDKAVAFYRVEWSTDYLVGGRIVALGQGE
jgi:hypothetical protein